ncbi:MAG: hypothetical protein JHC87_06095, partial [Thermoleophilaceae bacterium]|nr:hypothetical protein [Thermoleophilaceae bacterium]
YNDFESVVLADRLVTTVFVPVHGVVVESSEVNLGDGVQLIAADYLDAECLTRFADEPRKADCYCSISIDAPSDASVPLAEVRHEARAALTALRLFRPGSVSFGIAAQAEVAGNWRSVAMPFSGRAREEAWHLLEDEGEELRQFMSAVRRTEKRTRTSWALKRFEMGLERTVPAEGLTDFLAALRALLEATDDKGKAALPARVAALCARDDDRERVARGIECAFALERLSINGSVGKADRKRLAANPPLSVIADVERYVRALLHDLVCGYLATELRKLADEILLADGAALPVENAIDADAGYYRPASDLELSQAAIAEPDVVLPTQEFAAVFDDTAEITALDMRGDEAAQPNAGEGEPNATSELHAAIGDEPGPGDEWTNTVLSDQSQWWSPDRGVTADSAEDTKHEMPRISVTGQGDAQNDALEATTQTYSEIDATARMHQIAEELVDGFDRAMVESLSDDPAVAHGEAIDSSDEATAAAPEKRLPELSDDLSYTPVGGSELTFSFPVVSPDADEASPRVRVHDRRNSAPADWKPTERESDLPSAARNSFERTEFMQSSASDLGTDFAVPEFTVPDRVRQERLRELLGDHSTESHSLQQIMSEGRERAAAQPADHERPRTIASGVQDEHDSNVSDFSAHKRPHLVALNGGAAPQPADNFTETQPESLAQREVPVEPMASIDTPAADPVAEQPAQPEQSAATVDHDDARSAPFGPPTIEFRPLFSPDLEDPDDFAGAV